MREIVVISGKGGTGKTSITAALADLAHREQPVMLCDLDVDAPDLHLLLEPDRAETHQFVSGFEAVIDPETCVNCGLCVGLCRFDAIRQGPRGCSIAPMRCEGCKVCVQFCPAGAIAFNPRHCGQWWVSAMRFGPMVHAQLFPGSENSGRLVALLKKEARERAKAQGIELMLCDGAPGIGCPVISSLSGAGAALIVTEPTPSGLHDLLRVADLCAHFRIPAAVVINKYDLNIENSAQIERQCRERDLPVLGLLPHDEVVVRAMVLGKCVTELPATGFSDALRSVWQRLPELSRHSPRPGDLNIKPKL